jgi:hypothetical protein
MASSELRYKQGASRPTLQLWLRDDDGDLIDFTTGYTFVFKVGTIGSAAELTKSSGIAGAAGAGTEPDGTPNIVITPTALEFTFTPAAYTWQLTATTGGNGRVFSGQFILENVVD